MCCLKCTGLFAQRNFKFQIKSHIVAHLSGVVAVGMY